MTRHTLVRSLLFGSAAAAAALVGGSVGLAHKAVTSKYTYNEDVFPIVKEKCGACHVEGGVAPMSLMTYTDAFPWGESIRAELIAARMPPWNAEGGYGHLKHPQVLTPKEIDILLTWATGGNPEGSRSNAPEPVALDTSWPLGEPDVTLKLPEAVTVPSDQQELTHEFTVPVKNAEPAWVRAIDLLPDNAAMVRSATIAVKGQDGKAGPVITDWLPGGTLQPADGSAAFQLPANAELAVSVYYKKTWMYDSQELTDQSTVGVYYAKEGKHEPIQALTLTSEPLTGDAEVAFSQTLEQDVDAVSISPAHVPPHGAMQVRAVRPDGSEVPLIRINTRTNWKRRYWFEKPIALPRGTRIEVTTQVQTPFTMPMPDLLAPPEQPTSNDPLAVTLGFTPHAGARATGQGQ